MYITNKLDIQLLTRSEGIVKVHKIKFIITIFTYFCKETVEFYNIHILIYIFAII